MEMIKLQLTEIGKEYYLEKIIKEIHRKNRSNEIEATQDGVNDIYSIQYCTLSRYSSTTVVFQFRKLVQRGANGKSVYENFPYTWNIHVRMDQTALEKHWEEPTSILYF
jgi:hypothetical protein